MFNRRELLKNTSAGFGYLAFAGLTSIAAAKDPIIKNGGAGGSPLSAKPSHFPAKAKRVIFLCMKGGPSHVDTFDYKPQLAADHGKSGKYGGRLLRSPWEFDQHGDSGLWISNLFPNVAKHADELCLIRSMNCDQPVHATAMIQMHTGTAQFIRPSLGAWTLYGLGTENESLPGFVSLNPPANATRNYGSAFLPAIYSGTKLGAGRTRPSGRFPDKGSGAVPDIQSMTMSPTEQRRQLDFIQSLNRGKLRRDPHQPDVEGVIESFELAFRMQDELPSQMDLSDESERTLEEYGINETATAKFGRQCLLARRMAVAGVRFIEVTHGNWDQHNRLTTDHKTQAEGCDRPIAALLSDLKRRGMLDETLVIWGGEFGRTPAAQNGDGRNHNNKGYTIWMAGGGIKGGYSYGATDEHGYEAVEKKCHIHDWHATILHLMGLDHERLTYRYAGRDFRLTDVHGNVAHEIIA